MQFYTGFLSVVGGGFNVGGTTNPGVGNAIITGKLGVNMDPVAQVDFNSYLRVSGNSGAPASGAGLEFLYQSGVAYFQAYDRTGSVYKALQIEASVIRFNPNSAGYVGIGAFGGLALPSNHLHIVGAAATPSLRIGAVNTNYYWDIGRENVTTGDFVILTHENVASSEVARFTVQKGFCIGTATNPGAGNLGIGSVPSTAFGSTLSALIMGNTSLLTPKTIAANSFLYLGNNMLFDGGAWRAISADAGSTYFQQNGYHAWVSAVSVAAGATQTFVEKMRLHLSGGLSLGNTIDPGAANFYPSGRIITDSSTTNSKLALGSMEFQPYGINNVWFGDNCYFDGSNFKYRATGWASYLRWLQGQTSIHNFPFSATGGANIGSPNNCQLKLYYDGTVALGGFIDITAGSYTGAGMIVTSAGNMTLAGGIAYGGKIIATADTTNSRLALGSMEFHAHGLNNVLIADNLYYGTGAFRYRAAGYGAYVRWINGQFMVHNFASGDALMAVTSETLHQIKADYTGAVALGGSMTSTTPGVFTGAGMVVKLGVNIGGTTDPGAGNLSIEGELAVVGTQWVSYGVSVAATSGTITTLGTVTGRFKKIGKTVFVQISINITTNGTGAVQVQASLPYTAKANNYVLTGREDLVHGAMLQGFVSTANPSNVLIRKYDNSYPGQDGCRLNITGAYEAA